MAEELYHFIGGKRTSGRSGRFGNVFWPMTGEVAARAPLASRVRMTSLHDNGCAPKARQSHGATQPPARSFLAGRSDAA